MNVKEAREIVNRPRIVEPETLRSAIKHKNLADKMHLSLDELRSFAAGYLAALEGPEVKELLEDLRAHRCEEPSDCRIHEATAKFRESVKK